MSDASLLRLARSAGLATDWLDFRNERHDVEPETLRAILQAMGLPCGSDAQVAESLEQTGADPDAAPLPALLTAVQRQTIALPTRGFAEGQTLELSYETGGTAALTVERDEAGLHLPAVAPLGYHRLTLENRQITLAVTPARALGPQELAPGRKLWGLAAQLYSLRRAGDGGIGDFSALADFAVHAARAGADAVAVSPVHALFSADPQRFSPYAPSSRLFLNPLHIDPAQAFGAGAVRAIVDALGIAPELQRLEAEPLVDWPAAGRLRTQVLRALFDALKRGPLAPGRADPLAAELARFRRARGQALEDHARFEALHAHHLARGGPGHWRDWPEHDARGEAVRAFAEAHADEVDFHLFLQWLADRGLAHAQTTARSAGMAIGLIGDLAVGTDGAGSHAWSRRSDVLVGLSVGAPPDEINQQGQSWGLTTFSPRALVAHGYAPFLELLRASLRHAGGLRMDHVLGLNRLWLVPEGAPPTQGAYLKYPLKDLLRLIALESVRHRALIVGEDLGTVPEGFGKTLADAGVMGMRVLWFEREYGLFRDPSRWTTQAMALTSTHDLPTVAGWWKEHDIDWRLKVGQLPADAEPAQRERRADERRALWAAGVHAGVAQGEPPEPAEPERAVDAAIRFVARTPSPLVIVPAEDLIGADQQPNVPGTVDEHPNWRRRLPAETRALMKTPAVAARLEQLRNGRRR